MHQCLESHMHYIEPWITYRAQIKFAKKRSSHIILAMHQISLSAKGHQYPILIPNTIPNMVQDDVC